VRGFPGGGSHTFACHTAARPDQVWAALTDPDRTGRHLYGLAAHSTWEPDAPIILRHAGRPCLTGHVLCARPHERLSYVLQTAAGDPPVYVTWLIRPTGPGCTIRLVVDDPESADSAEDAEDVWLPVLAALQRQLDER
jgi:uncharacterized protein YndB with AHSA1/START domain